MISIQKWSLKMQLNAEGILSIPLLTEKIPIQAQEWRFWQRYPEWVWKTKLVIWQELFQSLQKARGQMNSQQWVNAIRATSAAFTASWRLIWNLANSGYFLIILLPVFGSIWGGTLWSMCRSGDSRSPGLKRRAIVPLEIRWVITSIHMWPLLHNSTWPQKNSSPWSVPLPQKHLFLLLVHAEKKLMSAQAWDKNKFNHLVM